MVGTTAQTVQRLETANMTVSMDWLERFSRVFSVQPSSLIRDETQNGVPFLGTVPGIGIRQATDPGAPAENEALSVNIEASDPVAIRLSEELGTYPSGAILIANRMNEQDLIDAQARDAHSRDALVCLTDGCLMLCNVVWTGSQVILVPLSPDQDVLIGPTLVWIAPIVMEVRYF